mmetsp:Transcript_42121/g.70276  ORF Transcript_42121/g.70276 Transcript_42121/m.70276 type:complete len:87 (-) Transcript_42121:4764-5024(-)
MHAHPRGFDDDCPVQTRPFCIMYNISVRSYLLDPRRLKSLQGTYLCFWIILLPFRYLMDINFFILLGTGFDHLKQSFHFFRKTPFP